MYSHGKLHHAILRNDYRLNHLYRRVNLIGALILPDTVITSSLRRAVTRLHASIYLRNKDIAIYSTRLYRMVINNGALPQSTT